jgi:hypothetical protein
MKMAVSIDRDAHANGQAVKAEGGSMSPWMTEPARLQIAIPRLLLEVLQA